MNIFVFGSNLAGRHGAGSALHAFKKRGAVYGQGHGRFGSSYAIPTKGRSLEVLALTDIESFVALFIQHARQHPDDTFNIVAIGCGLAGYKPEQIAPMFKNAPLNCNLPHEFKAVLNPTSKTHDQSGREES